MNKKSKLSTKNKQKQDSNAVGYSVFKTMPNIERGEFSVFDIENELEVPEKQDIKTDKTDTTDIKTTKRCGSVDKYAGYLKAYEKSKSDFIVVSYGSTKKIVYGTNTFLFSGVKGEKKPLGVHLISLVKKDIDKLIDSDSEYKIPKIPEKKPHLTFIHHRHLEYYGKQEALAIDINHCYWRTALLLGFVSEETYKKGIDKPQYKDGRLIAIGTLGKIITVRKYKAGIKVEEYIDDRDYLKYGGFFWAVISRIHNMMLELYSVLKEDFLMFLTDCVFIDPRRKNDAIKVMEKHGYQTKEYSLSFTDITEKKVAWLTDKGEHKHILHNQMLDKGV